MTDSDASSRNSWEGWYTSHIPATSGTVAWPGTVTWVTPGAEPPPAPPVKPAMPGGWKCYDCGAVLAPWVPSHDCPADDHPQGLLYKGGGVTAACGCCAQDQDGCSRCAGREVRGAGDDAE